MKNKTTNNNSTIQTLPAGMSPDDSDIEFVGLPKTHSVLWFQFGKPHNWAQLPTNLYKSCEELYLTDTEAVKTLPKYFKTNNINRLVEIYIYYMYGGCDNTPDVIKGVLQPCENFRETKDCLSLQFSNKHIDIEGIHLSQRDLKILDMSMDNLPDKLIADRLGISHSTFDFHKKNLFKKLGCDSKVSLVIKGLKNHILCEN
jgi:DNA-binding CsgD family transcriptional regulator